MEKEIKIPEGWRQNSASFADGGKAPEIYGAEPGPQTGEDDMHSKYTDPNGPYGAAKVGGGTPASYEGPHDKDMNPDGDPSYDVGQLHVEPGEVVVEQGVQHRRPYYLVTSPDEEYFYSVIPKVKSNAEEYRSPHKRTRSEALEAAYKVLNATLPEALGDQMHYVYPESEFITKSTASSQHT